MTDRDPGAVPSAPRPGTLLDVVPLAGMITDQAAEALRAIAVRHPGAMLRTGAHGIEVRVVGTPCGCATCIEAEFSLVFARTGQWPFVGMILCPECGNKRCPRATHHDQACSGSNEPGQAGSAYA